MATDYKKWDRIARDIVVSDSESTEKTKKKRRRRKGKKENVME